MPTWYARSFLAGVAIFDQEVSLVEQVSGHHLLYYTRLYRIRGSWGSFLTQLKSTRYRFQYTTHNAVLGSGIGMGRVAIACLEIESVGVKGIGLIYGD